MKACATVLLLLSAISATAEVKLADAIISDVQQECYDGPRTDTWMSWAAVDANIIQAWQDVYYDFRNGGTTPPNGTGTSATRGDVIYNTLRAGMDQDGHSYIGNGLTLWMQGKEYLMPFGAGTYSIASPIDGYFHGDYTDTYGFVGEDTQELPINGCFNDIYGLEMPGSSSNRVSLPELKTFLDETFSHQGHAAGIGIFAKDVTTGITTMHALTCWGYKTNESGDITLFLTDSYDETGLFKATVTNEGQIYSEDLSHIFDKNAYLLKSVTAMKALETGSEQADTSLEGHGTISLSEAAKTNRSVVVTEGRILSAEKGLSVSGASGNGVEVQEGAYAFTENLELANNSGIGLQAAGRTEAGGETFSATKNARGVEVAESLLINASSIDISQNSTTGNGGGMLVQENATVQIGNFGGDVTFSNNSAAQGGGLYNAGSLSVAEYANSVTFSGNSAEKGSAIYNSGILSIKEVEDSLTIAAKKGNTTDTLIYNSGTMELAWVYGGMEFSGGACAIDNDGVLYLGVDEGAGATFNGNSLRSAGTTYIGMDMDDYLPIGVGSVTFLSDNRETSIAVVEGEDSFINQPATFSGTADAASLGGINESSRLMDAAITTNGGYGISDISLTHVLVQNTAEGVEGALTLSNVMMDDTCSMAAASISLNEVTLLVADDRFASKAEGGVLGLDLSGIFGEGDVTGGLTINAPALQAKLRTAQADYLAVDFGEAARMNLGGLTIQGMELVEMQGNTALFHTTVPEPCAPALVVTALCCLSARRRKR